MSNIPLLKPSCTEAEKQAVLVALESSWWGMGPVCDRFEVKLAARYGYRHCITVNSGTAALHLACLANGIGPGDEVIVPALTFISTALAVTYCGAKPVFADVDEQTLCIDWADVRCKISERTRAIIPVDYAGNSAKLSGPATGGYHIVQDAAHSSGGLAYGNEVCFSFHAVKNIGTGDGGAILTNDDAKAERMRALRWCGIDRSTWERSQKKYGWDYDIAEVGYKCHWNDIQAAIGLVQLERLDEMNEKRQVIASRYDCHLEGLVQLPAYSPTRHLYAIRVDADKRDALIDHLLSRGISAGVHYKPLYHYPIYADQGSLPITEREWRRLVSLPIFPDMTDDEQAQVIAAVKEFFRS